MLKINKLTSWMLIFSVFFLVGINKFLSPVIWVMVISLFYFFYTILKSKKIYSIQVVFIFYFLLVGLVIFFQNSFVYLKYGFINELFRHLFWVLYGIVFFQFVNNFKSKDELYAVVNNSLPYIIFIFIFEFVYRLLNGLRYGSFNFYNFKFDSILYPDSNFTAFNLILIYIFLDNLRNNIHKVNLYKSLIFFLILMCFSRTIYLFFIFYVFLKVFDFKNNSLIDWIWKVSIVTLFSFFLVLGLSPLLSYINSDGSANTKLEIFEGVLTIFELDSFNPFLGIGSGNLIDYIGRESHNLWGLGIEMGGVWFFAISLLFILFLSEKNFRFITFVLLFSSLTAILPITYLTLFICLYVIVYKLNRLHG